METIEAHLDLHLETIANANRLVADLKAQLHIVTVDRDDLGDRELIGRIELDAHRKEVVKLTKENHRLSVALADEQQDRDYFLWNK